jgi:outer membrane protein assembly factor BamB
MTSIRILVKKLKRLTLLIIAIGLIAVLAVSSLIIYENGVLNPAGSNGSWQRPIENFATGLAADNDKVYVTDIFGTVSAYTTQSGSSIWNTSSDTGYFASGLYLSSDKVFGSGMGASVGCIDKATGKFEWSFDGQIGTDLWTKRAPDNVVVSGEVVASIDGGVSVHNADTGAFLWQASRPSYITTSFGNLTDLSNWRVDAYLLGGNPFEGNFVYVLSGNYSNPYVSKFNFETDTFAWSSNITLTSSPIAYPEGIPGYSGNAVSVIATYQGQVIILNINQILSFNATSGDQLWSRDTGASIYRPTNNNGMLLFGASDGNFYALNLSNGNTAWKTRVDDQNLISTVNNDNITLTTYPIQIQNNQVFWSFGVTQQLGTNSGNTHDQSVETLCSLDLVSGKLLWTRQIEDPSGGYGFSPGLVVNRDAVYLTENNVLWVLGASNGNLARAQHFDHYVLAPVTVGNEVFVASDLQLTAYG